MSTPVACRWLCMGCMHDSSLTETKLHANVTSNREIRCFCRGNSMPFMGLIVWTSKCAVLSWLILITGISCKSDKRNGCIIRIELGLLWASAVWQVILSVLINHSRAPAAKNEVESPALHQYCWQLQMTKIMKGRRKLRKHDAAHRAARAALVDR